MQRATSVLLVGTGAASLLAWSSLAHSRLVLRTVTSQLRRAVIYGKPSSGGMTCSIPVRPSTDMPLQAGSHHGPPRSFTGDEQNQAQAKEPNPVDREMTASNKSPGCRASR